MCDPITAALGGAAIIGGGASIFSGMTSSAPKISTPKAFARQISTPEYGINKGVLTQKPGATSSAGFSNIFGNLGTAGGDFAGLRPNLAGVGNKLAGFGSDLASLKGELRPGFGRITEARVKAIKDQAAASVGDLRTQFARRGVLGSSFGQDTESRTKLAFAQAEEQARAQGVLDEIGANVQITQQEIANQGAILGLNAEQRATIGESVKTYLAQATVLSEQIGTELKKLGLTGEITNNLNSLLMGQALNQAKLDMAQQTMNAEAIGGGIQTILGGLGGFGTGGAASFGSPNLTNTPTLSYSGAGSWGGSGPGGPMF